MGFVKMAAMIRGQIKDSGSLYYDYELTEAAPEPVVSPCTASFSEEGRRVAIYVRKGLLLSIGDCITDLFLVAVFTAGGGGIGLALDHAIKRLAVNTHNLSGA